MRLPLLYSDDQILYYNGYRPSLPDTILQRLPLVASTAARLTPLRLRLLGETVTA